MAYWDDRKFPNLIDGTYAVTSCATTQYNCIAWAAGEILRWWDPVDQATVYDRIVYWPPNAPPFFTVEAVTLAFASIGYESCDGGELEDGWEKIAIYATDAPDGQRKLTHAARQLSGGHWTSKLGGNVDIVHLNAGDVCGPEYGNVVHYLRRRRAAPKVV
jgi:hypothetical protein